MPEVTIIGAGIAGVSLAYHLSVQAGMRDVVLVDQGAPLSLTSDKSTEAYRNWWPGPDDAMIRLMNRSLDLLEELNAASGGRFGLNRRGYLFATADPARVDAWAQTGQAAAHGGAGPLRLHPGPDPYIPAVPQGAHPPLTRADLITAPALIARHFPYLAPETVAVLHVRRAGWLSAQQYGQWMLERARQAGVQFLQGELVEVEVRRGRVQAARLTDGTRLPTAHFVLATGPYLKATAALLGVDLPVVCERHLKVAFSEPLGALPREAPLLIWADPQRLPWDEEERAALAEDPEAAWLLGEFPAGVHIRPEGEGGSPMVLALWEYHTPRYTQPRFPVPGDPLYPEIVLRGLSTMLPGMRPYLTRLPRPTVDGGYYVKAPDNRPLVGPLPVQGAWVLGALSGFGIMASQGVADLLTAYLIGHPLPGYAAAFAPDRFTPEYLARWEASADAWQL
ncbi:MAG TPA: FAD-binding oxidoreductase [Anaerolineae bacterium]|nr:FAD-binding oxidoreductase [Anaerolineae bacterium]HID85254.1 FAD-binding oxidoreductase [Anaerolineales bacterium]HIQ09141.1 FAD-binding oxidoreductase [Anaerolineaceae bacterium]